MDELIKLTDYTDELLNADKLPEHFKELNRLTNEFIVSRTTLYEFKKTITKLFNKTIKHIEENNSFDDCDKQDFESDSKILLSYMSDIMRLDMSIGNELHKFKNHVDFYMQDRKG